MRHLFGNLDYRRLAESLLSFPLVHLSYDAPSPSAAMVNLAHRVSEGVFHRVVKIDHPQCSTLTRHPKGKVRILVPNSSPPSLFASEDKSWFEIYEAALLEVDPQKLPGRIVATREAVRLRLKDIEHDADHHAERQQIEDALNSLRVLERGSDAVQEAMSQETSQSCERDWREIAAEAAKETNPERLSQIVKQLCDALDKRKSQNQLRSYTPDRKSA